MTIEFKESSWIKYHYGILISDIGQKYSFTLIENYDSTPSTTEFEVVWPDGPPHNWRNLEKSIIEEFNAKEHA